MGKKTLVLPLLSQCDFIITDIYKVGAFSLQNHIFGEPGPLVL